MKTLINMFVILSLFFSITGCATDPMKAPCDNQGYFCGHKIKINQW
jgi:predicted small lipoprotein YifL